MITINSQPESGTCALKKDCLVVCVTTDEYLETTCADSFINIKIKAIPAAGYEFTYTITDVNSQLLAQTTFRLVLFPDGTPGVTFISFNPSGTTEELAFAIYNAITSDLGLMNYCQIDTTLTFPFNGSGNYNIKLFMPCSDNVISFANDGDTAIMEVTGLSGSIATPKENFKLSGSILEVDPYNLATKILLSDIELYLDESSGGCFNLSKRIGSFLSSDLPDIIPVPVGGFTGLIQMHPDWQKDFKFVIAENNNGEIQNSTYVNLTVQNTNEELACNWFPNQYLDGISECSIAFLYFQIANQFYPTWYFRVLINSPTLGTNVIDITGGSAKINKYKGLVSVNITKKALVAAGLLDEEDESFEVIIARYDSIANTTTNFEVYPISYKCNCSDSFLFLTERGIFEPLSLKYISHKKDVSNEVFSPCKPCGEDVSVFNSNNKTTAIYAVPRITGENLEQVKAFISSKEIWLFDGFGSIDKPAKCLIKNSSYNFEIGKDYKIEMEIVNKEL